MIFMIMTMMIKSSKPHPFLHPNNSTQIYLPRIVFVRIVSMKSTIKRHAQMHRFPGGLQSFRMVWKVFGLVGNCCKNIMMFMSQKRFTHFFDAFVAITIYALRPERFCTLKSATRKILTFQVSERIITSRDPVGAYDNQSSERSSFQFEFFI